MQSRPNPNQLPLIVGKHDNFLTDFYNDIGDGIVIKWLAVRIIMALAFNTAF